MKFTIIDTEPTYRRLLDTPDAATREAIFRDEIVAPFVGLTQIMGGGDPLATFGMWRMSPAQFAPEERARTGATLDGLAAAKAWQRAAQALHDSWAAFVAASAAGHVPHEAITFALLLGDFGGDPFQRGYTGFGGVPGYVMTVYAEATPYNLARVEAVTAHEVFHNLHFASTGFNVFTATVADYMIAEGLAESFAGALYGEETLSWFVHAFDPADLSVALEKVGAALDKTGFDVVRGYIFGDTLAQMHGGQSANGVPPLAGYALGYRAVQAYMRATGHSVIETIRVPSDEIVRVSGLFAAVT